MENRVRIENPCRENWNLMSQNKKGKFCNSCNQTVVDFRKMMHSDIQKYFVENKNNESICGYYKSNQVENKINIKYSNLKNRFNRIKIKPVKILALFCLSFLFTFTTSCFMGKRAMTKEELMENDGIKKKSQLENSEKEKDSIVSKDKNRIKEKK